MSSLISSLYFSDKPATHKVEFCTTYQIVYITKGSATVALSGKTFHVGAGDLLFLNSCDYYTVEEEHTPLHRYVLSLSKQEFSEEFKDIKILTLFKFRPQALNGCIHIENPSEIASLFEKMLAETANADYIYSDTLTKLYLHELFIWCCRFTHNILAEQSDAIRRKLLHAQDILEQNYSKQLKICDICQELHISSFYFTHQFTAYVGCSPKQYLTKIRLNHAGQMLATSKSSVSSVSEQVGFSDVNNFIRCFKNAFQTTPTQMRG